jgi:hypothetical protein
MFQIFKLLLHSSIVYPYTGMQYLSRNSSKVLMYKLGYNAMARISLIELITFRFEIQHLILSATDAMVSYGMLQTF